MPFVRVASTDEILPGQGALIERDGFALAVFNAGGGCFYACSPVCPHEDGPLAEGWLEGESVVCPWHGFDFNLRTGRCLINDQLAIPVYPVRVRAGAVEVDLP